MLTSGVLASPTSRRPEASSVDPPNVLLLSVSTSEPLPCSSSMPVPLNVPSNVPRVFVRVSAWLPGFAMQAPERFAIVAPFAIDVAPV